MSDYYLKNSEHPLKDAFRFEDDWPTSIGQIRFKLPEEMRIGLIKNIAKHAYQSKYQTSTPDGADSEYTSRHHYNMFARPDGMVSYDESITSYEEISAELIRYYVANSWGVTGVVDMKIKAKCFGNIQTWGQRTYPHYHHGFDGVMITYLTVGEEFTVDIECMKKNNWEDFLIRIPKEEPQFNYEPVMHRDSDGTLKQTIGKGGKRLEKKIPAAKIDVNTLMEKQTPKSPSTHPKDFETQGNMLLLDPRPAISYPYNRKARAIKPEVGLSVLHPGYLWHESNPFTGSGIRVAAIINFNLGTSKSADPLVEL